MLPLPDFQLLRPTTINEAASMLEEHGRQARLIAGGTDILVNMKHGLLEPAYLIDLTSVEGLNEVIESPEGGMIIGALCKLADIAEHGLIQARYPSLADALSQVAGPQHRNMGTLGGNVCLDTRCIYINQTHFWRRSLGYCLKKDGEVCHVVKSGKRCVAAQSSDSVPVLISLSATARLFSARGERTVPVESLFQRDGVMHLTLEPDEILTHIELRPPWPGLETAYRKLRVRKAIDYPALSLAVALSRAPDGAVERIEVVGSALMATPRRVSGLDKIAVGKQLTDEVCDAVAQRCYKQLVPLSNILVDPDWRREMVPVFVKRALAGLTLSTVE
jgi:4-hydroxybenzoyl-CoA reductase subunit beta